MHLRNRKKAFAAQRQENGRRMERRVGALLRVTPGSSEGPSTYSGSSEGPYRNVRRPVPPSWAAWLGIWDVVGPGGRHRCLRGWGRG